MITCDTLFGILIYVIYLVGLGESYKISKRKSNEQLGIFGGFWN